MFLLVMQAHWDTCGTFGAKLSFDNRFILFLIGAENCTLNTKKSRFTWWMTQDWHLN